MELEEVTTKIDGQDITVGYISTDNKTDYIYNLRKELVSTIYSNDYKVAKILESLEQEYLKGEIWKI